MKTQHHKTLKFASTANVREHVGRPASAPTAAAPGVGSAILNFCSLVEGRICGTADCAHTGQSCEAPGCDNIICKLHGHYCPRCEQRYCEDCHAAHLEACYGAEADAYDELVEREPAPGTEGI